MRRLIIMFVLAVAVTVIAAPATAGGGGCHGFTEEPATEIVLEANCFGPTVSHVAVGDTVTWRNADSWAHNVYSTAFDGSPRNLNWNDTFSLTFDTAGVFPYVCTLHPGMMGTLVVGDAVAGLKTVPATAPTTTAPSTTLPATAAPTTATALVEAHLDPAPLAAPRAPAPAESNDNGMAAWLIGAVILAAGTLLGTGIAKGAAR